MRSSPSLPKTPRELLKLPWPQRILYEILIAFFSATGLWRRPIRAYGDLERMRLLDKVYWIYKTTHPIRKARKGSDLENHFERQRNFRWGLPNDLETRSELSISSVGDLINHAYLANSGDCLYDKVADLVFGADVTMANLECPIFPEAKKDFVFRFDAPPPLYYDMDNFSAVKGYGDKTFTFMAAACNHSLDFGTQGLDSTINILNQEGIRFSGINADESSALRATLVERNGFKLGLIAYTFGLNNYRPPADRPNAVNRMQLNDGCAANDFGQLREQIAFCRKEGVDFVIAHLHWGFEHEFYPTPEQVELAHHIAELGIDAIIGHHPHVVQPLEFYRPQRDPDRVVPIYYSLGNLINYFTAPYLCRSGVARLDLSKGFRKDGTEAVYVKNARLLQVEQKADQQKKKIWLEPV